MPGVPYSLPFGPPAQSFQGVDDRTQTVALPVEEEGVRLNVVTPEAVPRPNLAARHTSEDGRGEEGGGRGPA